MTQDRPILILSGTNRPGSNTHRMARLVERHYASHGTATDFYGMEEMPAEVFMPAAYRAKPPAFVAVQERVLRAAGLHVVTPEYNGSFPGVLKYFIDLLKFPESFERKPVCFVGVANGSWGALRAVEQLQMVFAYRNAYAFPERVFVPGVSQKFDADGNLNDAALDERLLKQTKGFAEFACKFVEQIRRAEEGE
jgi:chromate reductase